MSDEIDLSGAVEKLQQMLSSEEGESQIQNILGALTGGGGENTENSQNQNPVNFNPSDLFSGMSDIETIMKVKNIMSALGNQKEDANTAFLNSLKPFLKKERRQKLDQATKIMSAAKVFKLFKDSGGV